MQYEELIDRGIRKIGNIDRMLETGSFPTHLQPNHRAAETFDTLGKKGHLLPNPAVQKIRGLVLSEEQKIKKARGQLNGVELQKLKQTAMKNVIRATEKLKKSKLEKILGRLDEIEKEHKQKRYGSNDGINRFIKLQEGQILNQFIDETEAIKRLQQMKRTGSYDEAESLILGSKSKACNKLLRELRSEYPPHLGEEGAKLKRQMEELIEEETGTLTYHVRDEKNNRTIPSRFNVIAFFSDEGMTMTAADFQGEPQTATA